MSLGINLPVSTEFHKTWKNKVEIIYSLLQKKVNWKIKKKNFELEKFGNSAETKIIWKSEKFLVLLNREFLKSIVLDTEVNIKFSKCLDWIVDF